MADTERIGALILRVVQDDSGDASNPRDWDNLSSIYGKHRNYTIGDGEPPRDETAALERGGIRLLYRWLRRYRGIAAFCKLGIYDHSGVTFYPVDLGENGHHAFDSAGWDSGVCGYAYITTAAMAENGSPVELADELLRAEIAEYAAWSEGDVWGYVITKSCDHADEHGSDDEVAACPHAETLDSCWGFVGDAAGALSEGRLAAESLAA